MNLITILDLRLQLDTRRQLRNGKKYGVWLATRRNVKYSKLMLFDDNVLRLTTGGGSTS
jgi:hypothetical protein